jgi:N-acetylglucosamine kinase
MEEDHVLGLDGGGTRTRCVIVSSSGHILARGSGGPSNPLTAEMDNAVNSIETAIKDASRQCGINGFRSSVMGIAGTERTSTIDDFTSRLQSRDLGELCIISDAKIALSGATGYRSGVVVISGTGSIAYGENDKGETARAGGWGWRLGDEGSGFQIGNKALIASLRDYDGRGPQTLLTGKILEIFELKSQDELVDLIYKQNLGNEEIASLSSVVGNIAMQGDEVALKILEDAGIELSVAATAVINRLRLSGNFPIALVGGVFRIGSTIKAPLERSLRKTAPDCEILEPRFPPEVGAALIALKNVGVEIGEELLYTIEASYEVLKENFE